MQTIKFKAGELDLANYEIFGYANPTTKEVGIQGLVREELPFETTKLQLKRFGKKLMEEVKTYQESSKELWEKFGEKTTNEDGQEVLKVNEDKITEFREAMDSLANSEVEITVADFTMDEFKFKSKTPEHSYFILEKLLPEVE
jgi:hypothetical protein